MKMGYDNSTLINKMKTMKIVKGILFLICSLSFISCDPPIGVLGVSENIKEAQLRKVFIAKYYPSQNTIVLDSNIMLSIKEAWVEKQWFHDNTPKGSIIDSNKYQLCINLEHDCLGEYFQKWIIGINTNHYLRPTSTNSLAGDIINPTDTIWYNVIKGNELNNDTTGKIIGKIMFYTQ